VQFPSLRRRDRHASAGTIRLVELPTGTRPEAAAPVVTTARPRLIGLDGIRGLAALYVVVYHIFLRAFPGNLADHAPFWVAGFSFGRFAVVVFIVLSGFSLSVAPARAGWHLDGVSKFARRRAWRILPPYWAALVFSLLMTWFVVAQPGWPVPTANSVAVNGLLVQDVIAAPSPNRAFWSIAIEAQLYVVFPLLILAMRRLNALAMAAAVAAPVLILGVAAAAHVRIASNLVNQYTPDLAVLFAIGVAAAGILSTTERRRSRPWHWFALVLAVPVFALIAWQGSVWTLDNLFWVDLAFGPAIGCLLAAIATDRPRPLVRLLDRRPLRGLGSFSYSLYLTHAPIVIAVYYGLMEGRVPQGVPMFLVLCAILLPLTVGFARLFAEVFELPFQRRRGWARSGAHGQAEVTEPRDLVDPDVGPCIRGIEHVARAEIHADVVQVAAEQDQVAR
jgi:peptidoglycan/LPS O-acetylase OafA/YrhL